MYKRDSLDSYKRLIEETRGEFVGEDWKVNQSGKYLMIMEKEDHKNNKIILFSKKESPEYRRTIERILGYIS